MTEPEETEQSGDPFADAAQAAAAGEPVRMTEILFGQTYALDGIKRRLSAKWPSVHPDDIDMYVSEAVNTLYFRVKDGKRVTNIPAFLWKVADARATDVYRTRKKEMAMEPEDLEHAKAPRPGHASRPGHLDEEHDEEYEERREKRREEALRQAQGLVPLLGQENIQKVMSYILEALAMGEVDISNQEIGEALGLSNDTVRTCRSRGFKRLRERAIDQGLADESAELAAFAEAEDEDLETEEEQEEERNGDDD